MASISVVIPAYNEARRIEATLQRVIAYLRHHGAPYEILVVDDGSTDQTRQIALRYESQGVRLLVNGINRGKGYSVRQGMLAATGDRILFSDADLSTPIETLDRFMRYPEDVVIGSRDLPESELVPRQPWHRWALGQAFRSVVHAVALGRFRDTQCGFKLFTRDAARMIFQQQTLDRFAFDVEVLAIAAQCGLTVREAPVRWANSAQSTVRISRDGPRMLADLWRVRRNLARGMYKRPERAEPPA